MRGYFPSGLYFYDMFYKSNVPHNFGALNFSSDHVVIWIMKYVINHGSFKNYVGKNLFFFLVPTHKWTFLNLNIDKKLIEWPSSYPFLSKQLLNDPTGLCNNLLTTTNEPHYHGMFCCKFIINSDNYRRNNNISLSNPHWHELWRQEKCSSLAPLRSMFFKTQRAWQVVKLTQLMAIFTSKKVF